MWPSAFIAVVLSRGSCSLVAFASLALDSENRTWMNALVFCSVLEEYVRLGVVGIGIAVFAPKLISTAVWKILKRSNQI